MIHQNTLLSPIEYRSLLTSEINQAEKALKAFLGRFHNDPLEALQLSANAFEASAKAQVFKEACYSFDCGYLQKEITPQTHQSYFDSKAASVKTNMLADLGSGMMAQLGFLAQQCRKQAYLQLYALLGRVVRDWHSHPCQVCFAHSMGGSSTQGSPWLCETHTEEAKPWFAQSHACHLTDHADVLQYLNYRNKRAP